MGPGVNGNKKTTLTKLGSKCAHSGVKSIILVDLSRRLTLYFVNIYMGCIHAVTNPTGIGTAFKS